MLDFDLKPDQSIYNVFSFFLSINYEYDVFEND